MAEKNRRLLSPKGLVYKPHIFSQTCQTHAIEPGVTLSEAIQQLDYPRQFEHQLQVYVDNKVVPQALWSKTVVQENQHIFVAFLPEGGDEEKNPFAFIASVALMVYAPIAGKKLAGFLGVGSTGAALLTAGFSLVGQAVINSVFPPPAVDFNQLGGRSAPESQNYRSDAARNKLELEAPVISLYGKHRIFPNYAASPFTVMSGDVQYIYMLFDAGYGKVDVSTQKFGQNRLLSAYQELELKIHQEFTAGDTLDFFTKDVFTETFALTVSKDTPRVVTTQLDCDEAQVDLTFGRGLTAFNDSGARSNRKVRIKINYRAVGSSNWAPIQSTKKVTYTNPDVVKAAGRFNAEMIINSFSQNVDTTFLMTASLRSLTNGRTRVQVYYNRYDTHITPDDYLVINNVRYSLINNSTWQGYANGSYWYQTFDVNKPLPRGYQAGTKVTFERAHNLVGNKTTTFSVVSESYAPKKGDAIRVNGSDYEIESVANAGAKVYNITITAPLNFNLEADRSAHNKNHSAAFGSNRTGAYVHYKDVELYDQNTYQIAVDIQRATAQSFTIGFNVRFDSPGQYELQVNRMTDDTTSDRVFDEFAVTQLRSLQYVSPISPEKPRTLIEMKVKVNEQINGLIEDYNFVGERHLQVGDGLGNYTLQATRNPAWIALDILTGDIAPRPLPFSRINHQSFKDFADWCAQENADGEPKFMCDFVMDFSTTVRQLVNQVVAVGRGLLIQVDGVYQIAIDQPKTTPKQMFTPRNINNFSGTRTYPDRKHFIKARFVDGESGYQLRNYKVYDDNYDESNSTTFESMDVFGVTRSRQAYEQTRWTMAQAISRSAEYTFTTDMEYLTCKRGDLVYLQHDVPRAGGLPARITDIINVPSTINNTPNNATHIYRRKFYFDRNMIPQSDGTHSLFVRNDSGDIKQINVTTVEGEPNALETANFWIGLLPSSIATYTDAQIGNLAVYGEPDSVVKECIVKEIMPQSNLAAELVLSDYAPSVFTADSGELPVYTPNFSDTEINSAAPGVVESVSVTQSIDYKDRHPNISISLTWNAPQNSSYAASFEIYVLNDENQYELVDVVTKAPYLYTNSTRQDQADIFNKKITFKILPVSNTGNKLDIKKIQPVEFTPTKDLAPPAAAANLKYEVIQNTLRLSWQNPSDVDFDGAEIRRSTKLQWENAQTVGATNHLQSQIDVEAVEAYYLVKTKDTSGNYSGAATLYFEKIAPKISGVDISALNGTLRFDISYVQGSAEIVKFRIFEKDGTDVLAQSESSILDLVYRADVAEDGVDFDVEIEDYIGQIARITSDKVFIFDGQEYFDFGYVLNDLDTEYLSNTEDAPTYAPTNGTAVKFKISSASGNHTTINSAAAISDLEMPSNVPHLSLASVANRIGTDSINEWANYAIPQGGSILDAVKNFNLHHVINTENHTSVRSLGNSGYTSANSLAKRCTVRFQYRFGLQYPYKRIAELLLDIKDPVIANTGGFPADEMPLIKKYVQSYSRRFSVYAHPIGNMTVYTDMTKHLVINNRALIKDALVFDIVYEVCNRTPGGTTNDIILAFDDDFLRVRALVGQNSGEADVTATGTNEVEWSDYFYDPLPSTTGTWDIRPQVTAIDVNRGFAQVTTRTEKRFQVELYDATGTRTTGKVRWTKSGILLSRAIDPSLETHQS